MEKTKQNKNKNQRMKKKNDGGYTVYIYMCSSYVRPINFYMLI